MNDHRATSSPLLRVGSLRKVYGGEVALADASFEVAAGAIHGLIGANGAGKSTLVRIVSGVERQDDGVIEIDGRQLPVPHSVATARTAGIGYIDQDRALVAELSIAENVALVRGYATRGGLVSMRGVRDRARAALAAVGLEHDVDAPVGELPISDQTMVAIARALTADARLILLDEPTGDLGATEATWLLMRLRELAESGVSCVLITHALGEALEFADTITVLRNGRVVATQPTSELDQRSLTTLMLGHELKSPENRAKAATTTVGASPPRLSLRDVRFERLGPLSLDVFPGEILALTGLADSGHLLVGDVVSGFRLLEQGSIALDGESFEPRSVASARRAGVVCVPPDRLREGLAIDLSSRENLYLSGSEFASRMTGIESRRERVTARAVLADAQVKPPDPEAIVATLSGGNMQKVLISKWLADQPRLIALCEPTVGVDVGAREEIYARLRTACREGLSVLLLSTDFEEVIELADRVLVLRYGSVVAEISRGSASIDRLNALSSGSIGAASRPVGGGVG